MKKLNWGQKMILFAGIFMIMVIGMVSKMMASGETLVEDDYYEKGMNYQKEIDEYAAKDYHLFEDAHTKTISMTCEGASSVKLTAKRASDAALDFELNIHPNQNGYFEFPTTALEKGPWMFTWKWRKNDKNWAADQKVIIQ